MAKRKQLSKKARFEVFKRDSFTCQYCGKSSPQVMLHVDHIKPVKNEGGNSLLNLITACSDCNLGKSARELSDDSVINKQKKQLDELQARREQLDMMLQWHGSIKDINETAIEAFCAHWEDLTNNQKTPSASYKPTIKKLLKKHSLKDLLETADIAAEQYFIFKDGLVTDESSNKALGKVEGILRNKNRPEHEQRFYYIRGILKNRFDVRHDWMVLNVIKQAYESGNYPLENIESFAKSCPSLNVFMNGFEVQNG